jgi:hypothetical protein
LMSALAASMLSTVPIQRTPPLFELEKRQTFVPNETGSQPVPGDYTTTTGRARYASSQASRPPSFNG